MAGSSATWQCLDHKIEASATGRAVLLHAYKAKTPARATGASQMEQREIVLREMHITEPLHAGTCLDALAKQVQVAFKELVTDAQLPQIKHVLCALRQRDSQAGAASAPRLDPDASVVYHNKDTDERVPAVIKSVCVTPTYTLELQLGQGLRKTHKTTAEHLEQLNAPSPVPLSGSAMTSGMPNDVKAPLVLPMRTDTPFVRLFKNKHFDYVFETRRSAGKLSIKLTDQAQVSIADGKGWCGTMWPAIGSAACAASPARVGGRQRLGTCAVHAALNCMVNQTEFAERFRQHLEGVLANNEYAPRSGETKAQVNERRFGCLDVTGLGLHAMSPRKTHAGHKMPNPAAQETAKKLLARVRNRDSLQEWVRTAMLLAMLDDALQSARSNSWTRTRPWDAENEAALEVLYSNLRPEELHNDVLVLDHPNDPVVIDHDDELRAWSPASRLYDILRLSGLETLALPVTDTRRRSRRLMSFIVRIPACGTAICIGPGIGPWASGGGGGIGSDVPRNDGSASGCIIMQSGVRCAAHQQRHSHAVAYVRDEQGLAVVDSNGLVLKNVDEVRELLADKSCKEFDGQDATTYVCPAFTCRIPGKADSNSAAAAAAGQGVSIASTSTVQRRVAATAEQHVAEDAVAAPHPGPEAAAATEASRAHDEDAMLCAATLLGVAISSEASQG